MMGGAIVRILHINSVPYGSTCRVMLGIAQAAQNAGLSCETASGYSTHPVHDLPDDHVSIGGAFSKAVHMALARLTGWNGCFSVFATLRLLRRIRQERYDLLHLHNLHGWYLHLPLLTRYIKKHRIPVIWTLHDCWAFTGQCAYYTAIGCERWKNGCYACPQKHLYPQSLMDRSRGMYRAKKRWFTSLPDVTLVTPSRWLAEQVQQSFLQGLPVQVIHNGIDLNAFRPAADPKQTDLYTVLGVADGWTKRKGLDVFIELASRMGEQYQIVLVGTDEHTERLLPDSIVCIRRTQNQSELARLYRSANVFVNPTYEDNFPTVNLESLACGTPVVAFAAGGSAECLDESCGMGVPVGDMDALEAAIRRVCEEKPFTAQSCVKRAKAFDREKTYAAYLALYRQKAGEPS